MYKNIELAMILTAMLTSGGCVTKEVVLQPSMIHELKNIQRGESTKQDVLQLFGPPVAIFKNEAMTKDTQPFEKEALQFEGATKDHIIYYYTFSRVHMPLTWEWWIPRGEYRLTIEHLWILIHEDSGIVSNYFLRVDA